MRLSGRGCRPFVLLGALCLLWAEVAGAVTVEDDSGRQVTLERPASRIVSLAPHVAELLFAAGAGGHLVGTVAHSDYPPPAAKVPQVGGYESLDLERILALRPDLVVAWGSGNNAEALAALRRLGPSLFVSEPRRPEDIPATLRRLGALAGTEDSAEAAAAAFERRLEQLRRRYAGRTPVSVFYQVWHQPLMTVGGDHLISRLITLCGGRNVFGGLDALAPTVTLEAVLGAAPEALIASGTGATRPVWLDAWQRWPQLPAVARGNVGFIPPDLVQRPTPRLLDGAERLCRLLEGARQRRPAGERADGLD